MLHDVNTKRPAPFPFEFQNSRRGERLRRLSLLERTRSCKCRALNGPNGSVGSVACASTNAANRASTYKYAAARAHARGESKRYTVTTRPSLSNERVQNTRIKGYIPGSISMISSRIERKTEGGARAGELQTNKRASRIVSGHELTFDAAGILRFLHASALLSACFSLLVFLSTYVPLARPLPPLFLAFSPFLSLLFPRRRLRRFSISARNGSERTNPASASGESSGSAEIYFVMRAMSQNTHIERERERERMCVPTRGPIRSLTTGIREIADNE